ncbi:hypothetical protein BKH45_07830 [Helicobacter sp. 11S03491-1]|nr:hypothetical protein BKH45_07830 [Helicobacter sp. 11S03491-1]
MSDNKEKSVIIKILSLYLITTAIFLIVLFGLYYDRGYNIIIHEKTNDLREDYGVLVRLIDKTGSFDEKVLRDLQILGLSSRLMIFDKKGDVLYNGIKDTLAQESFHQKNGIYVQKGYIMMNSSSLKHHKHHKKPFYPSLSPSFKYKIILKGASIVSDIWWLRVKTTGFLLLCLSGVGFIAYFLLKVSLKPLKERIEFLNHFIKDTTHEINTPISVILMSIQRLEKEEFSSNNFTKINRIDIAAKTLGSIYQNLMFYSFPENKNRRNLIDVKEVLEQRLEFFAPLIGQKNLQIQATLASAFISANKEGIGCILDNLLSNAIKYNKKDGNIIIMLNKGSLSIQDSGCGIETNQIHRIFKRYTRYNTSQGGFGIGLALVQELCQYYSIRIKCESEIGLGSVFRLEW